MRSGIIRALLRSSMRRPAARAESAIPLRVDFNDMLLLSVSVRSQLTNRLYFFKISRS
jgi:hypothetical protein